MTTSTETPVVVIVFNRPELAATLLDLLRGARPRTLLVVADGPRAGIPDDVERCAATRAAAVAVDWPCEVLTDLATENVGCRHRVVSGIDWAFTHVDRAIVLEDDVRPDPSFFPFCDAVLERYADDERVGHVSGRNPLGAWRADEYDYFFARTTPIWGWATWRRAWAQYDVTLERYHTDAARVAVAASALDAAHATLLRWLLDTDVSNGLGEWHAQWALAQVATGSLSVIPTRNLVANVGFGDHATHTVNTDDPAGLLLADSVAPPLRGPDEVVCDAEFEARSVQYDRLRFFRDARVITLAAQAWRHPEVRARIQPNPAVLNVLAALDDPRLCLDVLHRMRSHSVDSEHLARLERDFAALAEVAATAPEPGDG